MPFQPESPVYDAGVFQLEVTTPVQGGVGGASNSPLLSLSNRTAYLKQHVDTLETLTAGQAPLNSPAFTGTPTAPDVALGDRSGKIANTKFVQDTINSVTAKDVSGGSNVTLTAAEAGAGVLKLTGAITANIAVIVPNTARKWVVSNQTTGAFTLTVKTAAGAGVVVTQGRDTQVWCDATDVRDAKTDFASPAMTGNPTAPTATSGDNDTSVATTGFVFNATDGLAGVSVAGGSDVNVTAAQAGCAIINLTGALTANINLIMPNQSGQWVIANNSTGAFNITCKTAAGTGVVLPTAAVVIYGDGTSIYAASAAGQTSLKQQTFSHAGGTLPVGTTSLAITGGYTPGNVLVEKNGAWLEPADFTATDGVNVVLAAASIAGDQVNVYCFSSFQVANAVQKSGDTMSGALALFTGSTAPTPSAGDRTTKLATTAMFDSEFVKSIVANGYQKLPSGLIIQWGSGTAGQNGGNVLNNFPIAFPNAALAVVPVHIGTDATVNVVVDVTLSTTQFGMRSNWASSTVAAHWIAIGW